MQIEQAGRHALGLHWLAFLLTGHRQSSIDIAVETIASNDIADGPYFSKWMLAWSRRVVIAKALASIRRELAESARRTELQVIDKPVIPSLRWELDPATTRAELERALLAVDVFPRVALLLSVFEKVPIADAVVLIDADAGLIRKAQAIGSRDLTDNLARMQRSKSTGVSVRTEHSEADHG